MKSYRIFRAFRDYGEFCRSGHKRLLFATITCRKDDLINIINTLNNSTTLNYTWEEKVDNKLILYKYDTI